MLLRILALIGVAGGLMFLRKKRDIDTEDGQAHYRAEFMKQVLEDEEMIYIIDTLRSMNRPDLIQQLINLHMKLANNCILGEMYNIPEEEVEQYNTFLIESSDAIEEVQALCFQD